MVVIDSSQATQRDTLTGLLAEDAWVRALDGGLLPADGGLIAFEVAGIGSVNQTFGHAAGNLLVQAVVARARHAMPDDAVFCRGPSAIFYAWLPGITGMAVEAFVSHFRQTICPVPVTFESGEAVYPRLFIAGVSARAGAPAAAAMREARQAIVQQPGFGAPPSGIEMAVSARDVVHHRLAAMRLFGRDALAREVFARLRLPAMQPVTVLLVGPHQAGKTRLLHYLTALLERQRLPLATAACREGDQQAPCMLLTNLLSLFLLRAGKGAARGRLGPLLVAHPWLGTLFPPLRDGASTAPPDDAAAMADVLGQALLALLRGAPHVAVVHDLHLADEASRAALAAITAMPGHGLRLIAGTVAEEGEAVAARARFAPHAEVIPLPPLTNAQVLDFLRKVAPDVALPSIAGLLHRETAGLPLAIEATLRAWAADGLLALHEGRWVFFPERTYGRRDLGLNAVDEQRLAQAALAAPASIDLLAALWETSVSGARQTVARGRELGLLLPLDEHCPNTVQFADSEYAAMLAQRLTPSQQASTREAIAAVLRSAPEEREPTPDAKAEDASPARQPRQEASLWDIPPPDPEAADESALGEMASALRRAGMQYRLYPSGSPAVQESVRQAAAALSDFLASYPSLVIQSEGGTVLVNGHPLTGREWRATVQDLRTWMADGNLWAIGWKRGVDEEEVAPFLEAFATHLPDGTGDALYRRIAEMHLEHTRVLTRAMQGSGLLLTLAPPGADAEQETLPPPDFMDFPAELIPFLASPDRLDATAWEQAPSLLDAYPTHALQVLVALTQWFLDDTAQDDRTMADRVDALLIDRLAHDRGNETLRYVAQAAEKRLEHCLHERAWTRAAALLAPISRRQAAETTDALRAPLAELLAHLGALATAHGLLSEALGRQEPDDEARALIDLLGEHAVIPLITALKESPLMQERIRLMRLLREFGPRHLPLLLRELHQSNPWYVHRNLLQVLADIGTGAALEAVSEKIRHPDPRVRAEAVAAATQIAGAEAYPVLRMGLDDEHADVRIRALSLVGHCPDARVLPHLLRLLGHRAPGHREPQAVQVAACLTLGHFSGHDEARTALIRVIHPPLFPPGGKPHAEVRAAAVTTLIAHAAHPAARAALQRATRDAHPLVRQTAQRAWQELLLQTDTGA